MEKVKLLHQSGKIKAPLHGIVSAVWRTYVDSSINALINRQKRKCSEKLLTIYASTTG